MLFPFLRKLQRPRIVTTAPNAMYVHIRDTGDNNAANAFETLVGPPIADIAAQGFICLNMPHPPGPGLFMPQVEIPSAPTVGGDFRTTYPIGGGHLSTSDDSVPEVEIF